MVKEMNYELSFINVVESLSKINPQLMFEHKDNLVKLRANNASRNCLYLLNAPENYFKFDGESLCMIDYTKFKGFFDVFNHPSTDEKKNEVTNISIEYDEDNEPVQMKMKSTKRTASFDYRLANRDVIMKPVIKENPDMPDFVSSKLVLTDVQMKELNSMISLMNLDLEKDSIEFDINGNKCTIKLYNRITANKYEVEYEMDSACDKKFSLKIPPEGFTLLPNEKYSVEFSDVGLLRFTQIREDEINLVLYLASNK